MKIDTLPNGRQLTYGAYKDCSRPLRRCLKQVGSGSIEGGIADIKADSKALEEVSALLAVDNRVGLLFHLCHALGTWKCHTYKRKSSAMRFYMQQAQLVWPVI